MPFISDCARCRTGYTAVGDTLGAMEGGSQRRLFEEVIPEMQGAANELTIEVFQAEGPHLGRCPLTPILTPTHTHTPGQK